MFSVRRVSHLRKWFLFVSWKHGVDLGIGYKNKDACADILKYIAQVQMDQLTTVLAKAMFLSIQADGQCYLCKVNKKRSDTLWQCLECKIWLSKWIS